MLYLFHCFTKGIIGRRSSNYDANSTRKCVDFVYLSKEAE